MTPKFKVGDYIINKTVYGTSIHHIYDISGTHYFYDIFDEDQILDKHKYPILDYEKLENGETLRLLTPLEREML